MSKLLFVVHRYFPYPGGSEYFVQWMAEECLKRGHDVTVLSHTHKGDQNGVKVTSDYQILGNQKWDLILVHGGDCVSQNVVHENAFIINRLSPVLYMIIKPSESPVCINGLKHHRFLGYSTDVDIQFLQYTQLESKARRVTHGIVPEHTQMSKTTKNAGKFVAVSAGGFYPHKAMTPLAEAWSKIAITSDIQLHLYGYGETQLAPPDSPNVFIHKDKSKDEVMQAIADADVYIMNSTEEGFGLVLLEAMVNRTPWFARDIAGATMLKKHGTIYKDEEDLIKKLMEYKVDDKKIEDAYNYAMSRFTIQETVNDIENVLLECM
jgi:glycosyltransferase involved in cell wall biosynthesis